MNDKQIEELNRLLDDAEGHIGVEATEEVREDEAFLFEVIQFPVLYRTIGQLLEITRPDASEDEFEFLMRLSEVAAVAGIQLYRAWLEESRDIDIRLLEGRE